uniref:Uncharacterized protein n=1 Tax=Molossus molossus TaxID=27622 RepID=A0A7J8FZ74_MOLMO|nr:hypothetical protein HJG59_008297 [Molossus molossus]
MSALQRKDNVAWIPPSKRGGSAACSLTAGLSGHSRRSADPPAQAGQSHPRPPEGAEPHGPLHRPSSWLFPAAPLSASPGLGHLAENWHLVMLSRARARRMEVGRNTCPQNLGLSRLHLTSDCVGLGVGPGALLPLRPQPKRA